MDINTILTGSIRPYLLPMVVALLIDACTPPAQAVVTWTAGGAGYWTNAANWTPAIVPTSTDDVQFTSGSFNCTIDQDVTVNSLTVSNYAGTIMFPTGVTASVNISNDFYFGSGATLVPTYSSTNGNGSGRVITVGSNATLIGTINADSQGFPYGYGPGNTSRGAAHGGQGTTTAGALAGVTYGANNQPTSLGSGAREPNGDGGGAVKITVGGTLACNGTIRANGRDNVLQGAPAGGSIWLNCNVLTGNGTIMAHGGSGQYGSGGGGRVALEYSSSTFTGTVSIAGGYSAQEGRAEPGTLWEPKRFDGLQGSEGSPAQVTITNSYQYYFADIRTNYWNLNITNVAWVRFFDQGILNLRAVDIATTSRLDLPSPQVVSNYTLSALNIAPYGILWMGTGDTNVINESSGGTPGSRHGIGTMITVTGNAYIGGTLSANGRGFVAGAGPGNNGALNWDGGSYGGIATSAGTAAGTYGSLTQPTALGSGGGWTTNGGPGGGAIKLVVSGTLTVDGIISADGQVVTWDGGGSGGSIWLVVNTLAGTGRISARGYTATQAGAAGGRIAVEHTNSSFTGTVTLQGGGSQARGTGQAGTLYEPTKFAIGSSNSPADVSIASSYQYFFPNRTTNYIWNLTVDSNAWVEFHGGNLSLADLTCTNGSTLRFTTLQGWRSGYVLGSDINSFDMERLGITGSITVAGSSMLYLPAEGVYELSGDLQVSTGSTIYVIGNSTNINPASGGTAIKPHGIGVTFSCRNATIKGTISGVGQGFLSDDTNSPGLLGTWNQYSGGHGGKGGTGGQGATGPAYGSLTRPTALGSGGGDTYADGGAALRLFATNTLTVDGSITMNGRKGGGTGGGGGAGGSVWLGAGVFAGTGTVSAAGASDVYSGSAGGRMAIEYTASAFAGTISVTGGIDTAGSDYGWTGTYYQCQSPYPTACSSGYGGIDLGSTFSRSSHTNGVRITRVIDTWNARRPSVSWTDTSTDWASNQLDNVGTYTLSGLAPNTRLTIYTNTVFYAMTNIGATNAVVFSVSLKGPCPILVEAVLKGTLFVVR